MMEWLYEGHLNVYLVLAGGAVVLLALWARGGFGLWRERNDPRKGRTRKRLNGLPIAVGILALLALGYFVLDRFVETRREQITRKLQHMAAAVQRRDTNRIFEHISTQFAHEGLDRERFRQVVEKALRNNVIREVTVWDIQVRDGGKVELSAKPRGGLADGYTYFPVQAEFVRDPDGQWRLKGFQVFKPYADSKEPQSVLPFLR